MSKHTPGPWKTWDGWGASKFAPVVVDCIPDVDGKFVGNCICHVASTNENAASNACLIAAAPELLEALEKCLDVIDEIHMQQPEIKWSNSVQATILGRAAIAKAKGETR